MSYLEDLVVSVDEGERSRVRVTSDGRQMYEAKITLTAKGYEWLRTGLLCGNCMEDLRSQGAFPEHCRTCGFPVRELQLQQLQRDFVGTEQVGPRYSLSDELARLGDMWVPGDPI